MLLDGSTYADLGTTNFGGKIFTIAFWAKFDYSSVNYQVYAFRAYDTGSNNFNVIFRTNNALSM